MRTKYLSLFLLTFNVLFSQLDTNLQRRIQAKTSEALSISAGQAYSLRNINLMSPQALEQDCNHAIPICQNPYITSAAYSGHGIIQEIPSNSSCLGTQEKNSVWYTFTTGSSGNIAFIITPNDMSDDYDFALYDITGSNCSAISSGEITPIRCNFAATPGTTGLLNTGSNASEPASGSNISTVLATTPGRTYVLIISNYSSTQSGYTIDFTPSTVNIFDNTPPTLASVTAPCGSSEITFNASEQIKCSSIASNGSDFTINGVGGPYTVSGATGVNCGANTAQVSLTISPALSGSGPWTIGVVAGSDGNTLIDACGNPMAPNTLTFTTVPPTVTISGPSSICRGSNLALTASSASSYTWNGSAVPAGQQNQQTISLTANSAGTLNFTVNVTNGTCGNSVAIKAVTVTEAPQANFSILPSATVCAGTIATFTNTSIFPCSQQGLGLSYCNCATFLCNPTPNTSANINYEWLFGDGQNAFYLFGSPATAISPVHTYTSQGEYEVTLIATGLANSCSSVRNLTITVLPSTSGLSVTPSTTLCLGQSIPLTASGGNNSYTWSPSANLSSNTGSMVIAQPTTTTIYTVTSISCGTMLTNTVELTVSNSAYITVNNPTICIGQTATLSALGANTYTWSSGDISSTIIVTPTISTQYTVSGEGINNCSGSAIASVHVIYNPTLTVNSTTICQNQTATLSVSGANTYTWSTGSNSNSISENPYTTTQYSVSGQDIFGCLSTSTAVIHVLNSPTLTINSATICPGQTATLNVFGADTYSWSTGATSNQMTVSPIATENYTVIGLNNNNCENTITTQVMVYPSTTLTILSSTPCVGSITYVGATGASTYTWSNGETGDVIQVLINAPTIFTVHATDNNNCNSTHTVELNINPNCQDVWPGDVDNNGIVNNLDILELGLHFTNTGPPRTSIDNSWNAFYANNWMGLLSNGKNLNHSDCNGDGIINADDTLAINLNYGLTHSPKPSGITLSNQEVYVVPDQDTIMKGQWGSASIFAGRGNMIINDINGLAFTVTYNNSIIDANDVYLNFNTSFLDQSLNNLTLRKKDHLNGKLYIATTHTNNTNVSGYGKIATLFYKVSDTIAQSYTLNINLINGFKSNAVGNIEAIITSSGTLTVLSGNIQTDITDNNEINFLEMTPNPTSSQVSVSSRVDISKYEVYSATGQILLHRQTDSKEFTIELSALSNGLYFVKLYNSNADQYTLKKVILSK